MTGKPITPKEVVSAMKDWTPEQRASLITGAKFLGVKNAKPKEEQEITVEEDENFLLFHACVLEALRNHGIRLHRNPSNMPPRMRRALDKGWTAIEHYIEDAFSKRLKKTERLKFYSIVIKVCVDRVKDLDRPVNIRFLFQEFSNCPGLMNRQFPGYKESGLMPLILQWGDLDNQK